jgi:hypothetical protein
MYWTDKPPPPVAQFDLRAIRRSDSDFDNRDIQSARGAEDRHPHQQHHHHHHRPGDDRRRVNSARMDSEARRGGGGAMMMRPRMTTSSTSTVRLVNSSLAYGTTAPHNISPRGGSSAGGEGIHHGDDDSIHHLDMGNMEVGMRRAGSAPLSTINSEMDDERSIQWNLMPPSELPGHVVPPPTTIDIDDGNGDGNGDDGGAGSDFFLTELGTNVEKLSERSQKDMVRPSSSHGGISLT